MFAEIRFPAPAARHNEIRERLKASADWIADDEKAMHWTWSAPAAPRLQKPGAPEATTIFSSVGDGTTVASVEFAEDALIARANSVRRAQACIEKLQNLLGDLVGVPLTSYQTPEKAMAKAKRAPRQPQPDEIPEEVRAEVIGKLLDDHYRRTLDEPIDMLGNRSPRECAANARLRSKLVEWLKFIENGHARKPVDGVVYDASWLWWELGMEKYRG